jgi:NADPH:quinone reductase-like Zn-dependent oxidoreductase
MVVRVRATALNRGDLLGAIAFHRSPGGRPAGVEAAGEVHAVGAGVDFKPGDRVMTRGRGCFAEYVLVDPAVATLIPPHLSWEQGAAIPTAFVTAWEAMVQYGRIKAREWMLVVGASSGVGVAAIQIGRVLGVRMIGVSGSPAKIEKLKALGLDEVIRARGEDFSARVLEATAGRGVDLAVNLVGGTAFAPCQKSLANFGRLAIVGYVDGTLDARFDLEATHGKRLEIFGISNAPLTPAMRAEATRGFVRDVMPAITDGRIVPVIDRVFPFDRMAEAKAYVETDAQIGKVVARLE